jgi:hypothetical protein
MSMSESKFVFVVLSQYEREGWIHPSIFQYFCDAPMVTSKAYRVIPVHNFKPAASGRNVVAKHLKDCEADWIVMLDNDMHINGDLLDTVKGAPKDASIVVPRFYMWNQHDLKLTLCWGMEDAPSGRRGFEKGFYPLTKCGTGAIFIRPKVFQELEYPYFKYIYNADGGMEGTEDVQFCLAAIAKGFKIYGNWDVYVGHYHSVDLGSMWKWREEQNFLDSTMSKDLISQQKDSERSSDQAAAVSVPAQAE